MVTVENEPACNQKSVEKKSYEPVVNENVKMLLSVIMMFGPLILLNNSELFTLSIGGSLASASIFAYLCYKSGKNRERNQL